MLYARHTAPVYGLLCRLAGRNGDASDLMQETWLRAVRHLALFRGQSAFRTWLTGIALNCYREWRRRHAREVELPDGRRASRAAAATPTRPRRSRRSSRALPSRAPRSDRSPRHRGIHARGNRRGAGDRARHVEEPAVARAARVPAALARGHTMTDEELSPEEQGRLARARGPMSRRLADLEHRTVARVARARARASAPRTFHRDRGGAPRRPRSLSLVAWALVRDQPRGSPRRAGPRFVLLLYAGSRSAPGSEPASRRQRYAAWARDLASRGVAITGKS